MAPSTETLALVAAKMLTKAAAHPAKVQRIAKGLTLALGGHVQPTSDNAIWEVRKEAPEVMVSQVYTVTHKTLGDDGTLLWTCNCPDFTQRHDCCRHIAAAYMTHKAAQHYTHTDATGATVLLGNKALADAQHAQDQAAGGFAKLACENQHRGR